MKHIFVNISSLVQKEYARIKADKRTLVLLFLIPAIVLVIFGLSTGGGPTTFYKANIITRDDELSSLSPFNASQHDEDMINSFANSTVFDVYRQPFNSTNETEFNNTLRWYKNLLKDDEIDVIIVIPENFSETIENGMNTTLEVYYDASDPQVSSGIHVALQEPISLFRVAINNLENMTIMVPYLEFDVPFWESQILNYAFPIIISMIMLGTCMNLTSLSIVSEKPLARMLLAPTGKTDVVFSKLAANTTIMFLQSAEIFALSYTFGLFARGPLIVLFLTLVLIGFVGVCIGLFISAISKTEQVANQLYIMFFIAFTLFCQNFLPIEQMPDFVQGITSIFPLSHAIPLLADTMYRGMPLDWVNAVVLAGTALLFYLLALMAYSFKKVEA